ncbi:MAG: von Willebrand factor type A domain-containing protein [Pseudomonadales bacterium]
MNRYTLFVASLSLLVMACADKAPHKQAHKHHDSSAVTVGSARAELEHEAASDLAMSSGPASFRKSVSQKFALYPTAPSAFADREHYLAFEQNGVQRSAEQPVSTFSIDVDTAAYSNVRRMLQQEGRLPPSHAVRIEEMINYFDYNYPQPGNAHPFSVSTELAPSPWHAQRQLLQIGIKAFEQESETRPAANLVFLVDVSGSMQAPNKLGLVKKSLRMLTRQMNKNDRIALVAYAGAAGLALPSTSAHERSRIFQAIDSLTAGGSTNGSAGILLAYEQAKQHYIEDGINRVIIASDGDMNVGTVDLDALKDLIAEKRKSGISLTTLGFGTGNYNYALMEQLADTGNGNAAYIDNLSEAQKVLVQQMNATLLTVASDVKVQIEFNPKQVAEYRLIGYENRLLQREDFSNDQVDAGDIGAGHTVTALYEITPSSASHRQIADLRYEKNTTKHSETDVNGELAYVKLRYKRPGKSRSIELQQVVNPLDNEPALADASDNLRFAASVAGFGGLLSGGRYSNNWTFDDALELARGARGKDPHGYRGELIRLVELAQSFSEHPKDSG